MTSIGILGSEGRMGRAVAHAIHHFDALFAGGIDSRVGNLDELASQCDVLIDFSMPDALGAHLKAALKHERPIVIGTTGLDQADHMVIDDAAKSIPVLQTGNTSLGITMLASLVRQAAKRLGPDWDIEIVETHHRNKTDAPSGTALLLGEAAAEARGIHLDDKSERGRDGTSKGRGRGAIGFASLRGGTVPGDHNVHLLGESERITLSHVAEDRRIFARGAVQAAIWLSQQEPGRYSMHDVLGV